MKKFIMILLGIIMLLAMASIPATISEWLGWAYGWK